MGAKRDYRFNNKDVPGQQISFSPGTEYWNQYDLEDGTQLKIKTVLLDVARLDEYNEHGDPIYLFTTHQIVGVQVPDELKRKKETSE